MTETKAGIISQVKTPLGLLTLMVLVAEGLLFALAKKATGTDFTIIVIGMIAVIPLVLLVLYLRPAMFMIAAKAGEKQTAIYDVFISTPMAGWNDKTKYRQQRTEILNIVAALHSECKFRHIFYAGSEIDDPEKFEAKDISAKEDFDALLVSKYLLFVYPEKIASGALVEVGAAIAAGIPCLLFVPNRKTLPFMLEQADQVFHKIKIYEVSDNQQIVQYLKQHGSSIFPDE